MYYNLPQSSQEPKRFISSTKVVIHYYNQAQARQDLKRATSITEVVLEANTQDTLNEALPARKVVLQPCYVLPYWGSSRSIEDWALDTLRNTFIQSVGQRQADLVVITRHRTGRLGKLDICRRLFQRPAFLIIEDNTEICDEFNRSPNTAAFHIQLPKRDLPQIGRSFTSVFEAEPSILGWIGS